MKRISHRVAIALSAISMGALTPMWAFAQETTITVSSTTSTEQSGLFGYLLPSIA